MNNSQYIAVFPAPQMALRALFAPAFTTTITITTP